MCIRGRETLVPAPWCRSSDLRTTVRTAILVLALFLGVDPASAKPEAERPTLVVGVQQMDFFPYFRPRADGEPRGYFRDLLERFAADRGYRLELVALPIRRMFLESFGEEVDLFIPDNPRWSLDSKQGRELYYSRTVATALDGFAVLPGRESQRPGPELEHVGTMLGFTIEPVLPPAARENLLIERASQFESLFRALLLGRIDAVYCNVAVAHHALASLGRDPRSVSWSQTLPRFKSPFHVSSRHRDLIRELDDWMTENEAVVTLLKRRFEILSAESTPWGVSAGVERESRSTQP